jgi:hypothetical protein
VVQNTAELSHRHAPEEPHMEEAAFLQAQQARLTDLLRPYQREVNRRQHIADFVNKCLRSASRDDFFQLYDLLHSKLAAEVEVELGADAVHEVFECLRQDAVRKVERYQMHFLEDFTRLVQETGLPLENNFPRLQVLKGIELEVSFTEKHTLLNGKVLKTLDPQRILRAVLALKRHLYDRPFAPQQFIDGLFAVYQKVNEAAGRASGEPAPMQTIYMEYTLSLQSRGFFQDMAKGKFREYDADQFAVDFWRYFTSDVSCTSDGYVLRLTAGRGNALWVIDANGEKRRITSLTFLRE